MNLGGSVAELESLLEAARRATREDRIEFRNPIAEYGTDVIPAMTRWTADPELGAFAVRVLERVAEHPPDRIDVVLALSTIHPETVSAPVARDIADALARLDHRRTGAIDGGRASPSAWSGYAAASPLEQRFHDAMLDIFRLAGEATRKQRADGSFIRGYWASYFLRGVRNHGGLAYARQLLQAEGTTEGFARLTEEGRLDLTMEALVLRPEFEPLFSPGERQVASSRLARAGYQAKRS